MNLPDWDLEFDGFSESVWTSTGIFHLRWDYESHFFTFCTAPHSSAYRCILFYFSIAYESRITCIAPHQDAPDSVKEHPQKYHRMSRGIVHCGQFCSIPESTSPPIRCGRYRACLGSLLAASTQHQRSRMYHFLIPWNRLSEVSDSAAVRNLCEATGSSRAFMRSTDPAGASG